MPGHVGASSVLVISAMPVIIGQACVSDCSSAQANKGDGHLPEMSLGVV